MTSTPLLLKPEPHANVIVKRFEWLMRCVGIPVSYNSLRACVAVAPLMSNSNEPFNIVYECEVYKRVGVAVRQCN